MARARRWRTGQSGLLRPVSVPGHDGPARRTSAGIPIGPYSGDDGLSAWIGPNNDAQLDGPVGLYDYQTTFDLTGFDASTASITGGWSSDNNGVEILINGVDSGNAATDFAQFGLGFAPFTISSGFLPGVNTIDFIVNNGGGPTALRTELTGTADVAAVPEPTSMVLLGTGLMGGAVRRWRMRRNAHR